MSTTGFESFDTAVQKADLWLKELSRELGADSKKQAYSALRAVLHTLRDRLNVDEAADLGAQLPMLIRGVYYDEWNPSKMPVKDRHLDDFLNHIRENYSGSPQTQPEVIAKAVFKLLRSKVTEGEIKDIKSMMPKQLLELWT
ncbi:MAG: DUF2267 domain-containing protein [Chitinispirillales bacterium]|jgi:uncharacterized protein (DUF2267 family)|nr:DUF2267 domain-containing protein [Chitinispirillales bacterium]